MDLHVHQVAIDTIVALRPLVGQIERRDRDLAKQIRRSASSVPLNIAEGSWSRGGNKLARFETALGSAKETMSALKVAVAWGYVRTEQTRRAWQLMDQVAATLFKLVDPPR